MTSKSESYSSGQEDVTWLTSLLKEWIYPHHYLGDFGDCTGYRFWALTPFIILFSPPLILIGFMFLSNLLLHIYKRKNNLKGDYLSKSWDNGRRAVAYLWHMLGIIWHGYEVCGMEKVPKGPALVVFYHGGAPLDYIFFICRLFLQTGRLCHSVVAYSSSKMPGIQLLYNVLGLTNYGRIYCIDILKKGNLLGVFPGGMREALFSDENYGLLWCNHTGFAHVAIDAKVPIIPTFTTNVREGYRTLGKIWPLRWLYERTRWPLVPAYGGFPVKFCTYVGDPIPYDPHVTAEELAEKTKTAIENLRDKHQRIPGSIWKALLDRFCKHPKYD